MNEMTPAVPTATSSYETTRFNALRHGLLSRYTVLPWEDEGEYRVLVDALVMEHAPSGPTEEHLVEELAGILWRKRRLRLAEAAAFHRGLKDAMEPYHHVAEAALAHLDVGTATARPVEAIQATPVQTQKDLEDLGEDEVMTVKAQEILRAGRAGAYNKAVAALREDTRDWWQEKLTWEPDDYEEGDEPYTADAAGLLRFLETEVRRWYVTHQKELANRPLIREQAFGEAHDPDKLDRLGRYEVHLDRKLERTLAMLLKLKELRRDVDPA